MGQRKVNLAPKALQGAGMDRMIDPQELVRTINATMQLTDEAFEDGIHNLGFRTVLWHMRAGAIRGDLKLVQACNIYLARCDSSKARRKPVSADRNVTPVAFLPKSRESAS